MTEAAAVFDFGFQPLATDDDERVLAGLEVVFLAAGLQRNLRNVCQLWRRRYDQLVDLPNIYRVPGLHNTLTLIDQPRACCGATTLARDMARCGGYSAVFYSYVDAVRRRDPSKRRLLLLDSNVWNSSVAVHQLGYLRYHNIDVIVVSYRHAIPNHSFDQIFHCGAAASVRESLRSYWSPLAIDNVIKRQHIVPPRGPAI